MTDPEGLRERLRRRYATLAAADPDTGGAACCEAPVGSSDAWGAARYDTTAPASPRA